MKNFSIFLLVATSTFFCVSSRAVNISNTWVLPEEGFPVFYRYFRDRISWYEADAVCQFHHASLVTVDSTSQYDAVRAYLKELDIIENVWLGLSRSEDTSPFMWTDFLPLSNDGHWQEQIPVGAGPLCAALDPSADFRWHPLLCGGPEVVSFICELPVPTWANGPKGCLLTELPSLTVLYIPEESSLELTADCGLDGMKKVTCKGDADKEALIGQLSCAIPSDFFEENKTTRAVIQGNTINVETTSPSSFRTTKPWIWTSNTIDADYATRHRRETDDTSVPVPATRSGIDRTTSATMRMDTTTEFAQEPEAKSGPEEYPGVINQGQLFSIIENGTMFDIIELTNNSNEEALAATKAIHFTTVLYHKEPTEVPRGNSRAKEEVTPTFMESKSSVGEKKSIGNKSDNDLVNDLKRIEMAELNKEFEMPPIAPDSLIKLNRTNRKELPNYEEDQEKVVEIRLFKEPLKKLLVTSKIAKKEKRTDKHVQGNLDLFHAYNKTTEITIIDPRINDLNAIRNGSNDESESIASTLGTGLENRLLIENVTVSIAPETVLEEISNGSVTTIKSTAKPRILPSHPNLQKSEFKEVNHGENVTQDVAENVPQEQPRPNRQRLLTKTQRRSFYPYFFSRVLG